MKPIQIYDSFNEQYLHLSLSDSSKYARIEISNDCGSESFDLVKEDLDEAIAFLTELRKEMF